MVFAVLNVLPGCTPVTQDDVRFGTYPISLSKKDDLAHRNAIL